MSSTARSGRTYSTFDCFCIVGASSGHVPLKYPKHECTQACADSRRADAGSSDFAKQALHSAMQAHRAAEQRQVNSVPSERESEVIPPRWQYMGTILSTPPTFLEGIPAARGRLDPPKSTMFCRSKNHMAAS